MYSAEDIESKLREVLSKELRLTNLTRNDNLIELDPDFPAEEVIKDVLEAFGHYHFNPSTEDWQGVFFDLVRVIKKELDGMGATKGGGGECRVVKP